MAAFLQNRVTVTAFAIVAAFGLAEALVVGPPGMRLVGWLVAIVFVALLVFAWFDNKRQRDRDALARNKADLAAHMEDMKAFARRMHDRVKAGVNAWETTDNYWLFKQHYPDIATRPSLLRLNNVFSGQGGGSCHLCDVLQNEAKRLQPHHLAKDSSVHCQQ